MEEFLLRVLRATAFDCCDDIFWRTDGEYAPITFLVLCNDLFYWGCADCEPITTDNIDEFEKAYEDCRKIGHYMDVHAAELFCCRVRKMRPQGCCYPRGEKEKETIWPLFDACGPEREVGLGNPYLPGEPQRV